MAAMTSCSAGSAAYAEPSAGWSGSAVRPSVSRSGICSPPPPVGAIHGALRRRNKAGEVAAVPCSGRGRRKGAAYAAVTSIFRRRLSTLRSTLMLRFGNRLRNRRGCSGVEAEPAGFRPSEKIMQRHDI
jgi:hypothetical protein